MKNQAMTKTEASRTWSSVKALPTRLMDRLWDTFHNQVVEEYGVHAQAEAGIQRGLKPIPIKSSWPPVV